MPEHLPTTTRPAGRRTRGSRRSATLAGAAALLAVATLAACGTSEPSQAEEDEQNQAAGGPVELTDAAGRTVELPAPAEDVVVLEWQQVEDVLSLGVEPVGVADVAGYNTWDTAEPLSEDVRDVGMRGEPNKNAINEADPDLIIVEVTGPSDAIIGTFEDLGIPVLATLGADAKDPIAQMKETFELIAQALGKEDEAAAVLEELDATLAQAEEDIAALDLEDDRFAYVDAYAQGSTVSIRPFGQGSLVGEIGEAIGLRNVWEGEVDPAYGLGTTDLEGLTAIGDAHLLYTSTDANTWLPALEENPLWRNAGFVEADKVSAFPQGIWTFGGPRSAEQIAEAFVTALGG